MIYVGRKRWAAPLLTLFLLFGSGLQSVHPQVVATPYPRVESALLALDATDLDEDWYFTMALTEGDELQQIESDPTRAPYERRKLVAVNGKAPDAARLARFAEAEKKRIDEQRDAPQGYAQMVDLATLEPLTGPAGMETYAFMPRLQKLDKAREHLRGHLLMDPRSGSIRQLKIYNTDTLSPAFSVSVDTFSLQLDFGEVQGDNLVQSLQSRVVGKAGFLKRLDSAVDISFSDFRRR